jgi:hypothetical protein
MYITLKFHLLFFIILSTNNGYSQNIYGKCWYSDSAKIAMKIREHGYSFLSESGYDSLSGIKFKIKTNYLTFTQKYWSTFYYRTEKQKFIILRLTEDTLIIKSVGKKHNIMYSILEINYERIIFTTSNNKCNFNGENFYRRNDNIEDN